MKRTVWSLALVPGLLITIAWPDPVQAQAAGRQCAGQVRSIATYRQEAVRMGVTPERVREVYAVVDCNLTRIRELAGRNGVQEATLVAVTRELGLRNNATAAQIIAAIDGLAGQVANLNREITALRAQLGTSAAQRAIVDIEARLASGDLDGAAAAFAALNATLRTDEGTSRLAFDGLIRAQAQLAYARGDIEEGWRVANAGIASRAEQRRLRDQTQAERREQDRREDLAASLNYSDELGTRGALFGRIEDLREAQRVLVTVALPLVPRPLVPAEWAAVENRRGLIGRSLGALTRDINDLNQAMGHFRAVLEIYPNDIVLTHNVATIYLQLFRNQRDFNSLNQAFNLLGDLHLSMQSMDNTPLRIMVTLAFGEAVSAMGHQRRDAILLRRGITLLESLCPAQSDQLSIDGDPFNWATCHRELARSYFLLGVMVSDSQLLERSQLAASRAQTVYTDESAPLFWRLLEYDRAAAMHLRGLDGDGSIELLNEAEATFVALRRRLDPVQDARLLARVDSALVDVRRSFGTVEPALAER